MRSRRVGAIAVAVVILFGVFGAAPSAQAHDRLACDQAIVNKFGEAQKVCRLVPHRHGDDGDSSPESAETFLIEDVRVMTEYVGGVDVFDERSNGRSLGSFDCPNELAGSGAIVRSVNQFEDLAYGQVESLGLDPTNTYAFFRVICRNDDTIWNRRFVVRTAEGPGFEAVFQGAYLEAIAKAGEPQVATSPPERGVVRFPTWYWVTNWAGVSGDDQSGYITIEVTGKPLGTVFTTGNDDGEATVTCAGAGQAWDPDAGVDPMSASDCSYTYEYPSAWDDSGVFEVGATTSWSFRWSINGVDQGEIGELERINRFDLQVVEIQTVGVASD